MNVNLYFQRKGDISPGFPKDKDEASEKQLLRRKKVAEQHRQYNKPENKKLSRKQLHHKSL